MRRLVLDLDDDVYAALKARARAERVSIAAQALWELERGPQAIGVSQRAIDELEDAVAARRWDEIADRLGIAREPVPVCHLIDARRATSVPRSHATARG